MNAAPSASMSSPSGQNTIEEMKIATVIGARPQFIKAAAVSSAIADHNRRVENQAASIREFIIHTGQHYDHGMSRVFFEELGIPAPDVNLKAGSGSHGKQTGRMLADLEEVLMDMKPDWVLVYGDTNSTLAAALAAVKLHIPVAHVESGLRSFNRKMPEEINRVVADHVSDLLFCPTETAVKNLSNEGVARGVHLVGDVMYDSVLHHSETAEKTSGILKTLDLEPGGYALATVHRAENTDNAGRLASILGALDRIAGETMPVVTPMHPRTKKMAASLNSPIHRLRVIEPVSYLEMLLLEKHSRVVLTDSGGVQKEAYWLETPCITLRDETEWTELLEHGCNCIAGADADAILEAFAAMKNRKIDAGLNLYGRGDASVKIIERMAQSWRRPAPSR